MLYFKFWQRDCDQCESDRVLSFETWYEAADYIKDFHDWAEGPCSVNQMTAEQFANFQPEFRDHRAEQYNY